MRFLSLSMRCYSSLKWIGFFIVILIVMVNRWLLYIISISILCKYGYGNSIEILNSCDDINNQIDTAKISYTSSNPDLELYGINTQCYKCISQMIVNSTQIVSNNNFEGTEYFDGNSSVPSCALLYTPFHWNLQLINSTSADIISEQLYLFGEQGEYNIYPFMNSNGQYSIHIDIIQSPIDSLIPIYYLISMLTLVAFLFFTVPRLSVWLSNTRQTTSSTPQYQNTKFYPNRDNNNSIDINVNQYAPIVNNPDPYQTSISLLPTNFTKRKVTDRLQSLDTFRGLSLLCMIFVNYGGGGYWFFDHAAWNGLTFADLLFPWFMWMMGVSMAMSLQKTLPQHPLHSMHSQFLEFTSESVKINPSIWLRMIKRSCILFLLGLFLANGYDYEKWRVPGVLQYFGVSYLITASTVFVMHRWVQYNILQSKSMENDSRVEFMRLINNKDDLGNQDNLKFKPKFPLIMLSYYPEWILQGVILLTYLSVAYGAPAPGCPAGYLGPGGLGDNNEHPSCTGGIHRYIDVQVFGYKSIYHKPTCMELYQCVPYDPEGILGSLPACTLTYLGLMSGRIIIHFQTHKERIMRWIAWSVVMLSITAGLCSCSQNEGIVPINKNLWSTSFVLVSAGGGLVGLTFCYYLIDVRHVWTGAPFLYLGMNSILIYCSHGILHRYFPFSYKIQQQSHTELLTSHVIGVFCWVIIAYYWYKIKFFVKI